MYHQNSWTEDNMKRICLTGGPVYDGDRLIPEGSVVFDEEGIIEVCEGIPETVPDNVVDVMGNYILPGFVDLHSDTLEKCIEMRPGVFFDHDFAIRNLDRRLSACGITTFCHAISYGDNEIGLRAAEEALSLVRLIRKFAAEGDATIRHKVHLRYEISADHGAEVISRLFDENMIDMLSIMDHTPGQGQFKSMSSFVSYYGTSYDLSDRDVVEIACRKKTLRDSGWENVKHVVDAAKNAGLPVLSHDDDSERKIEMVRALGVTASEFPVSIKAARLAKEKGMHVFMGAPNLVRGKSSNGHISASETIENNVCDGLISDYYPECLTQAPFSAQRLLGLDAESAFRLVTSGPGDFLAEGMETGYLKPSKAADIVVMENGKTWNRVSQTWVGGKCVYLSDG